jgi:diadenylate cyclase
MSELGMRLSLFFARDSGAIISDCVDVILVSLVLYCVLLLLKGTRLIRIGFGVALLFAVHQSAKQFQLATLETTLSTLLTPILLLVAVIFQNDFRRSVQTFARIPFFSAGRAVADHQLIEDLTRAAGVLARKRIGALVVLERTVALDQFVEAGTVLNATFTAELLYSLFIPSHENPLHDGAVVIRDGRIWRAGAFLPLSVNAKLDRNLGTRHRAALGITEESDAVVIVVSEERGEVSLCVDGILARNLNATLLNRILSGLFKLRERRDHRRMQVAHGRDRRANAENDAQESSSEAF